MAQNTLLQVTLPPKGVNQLAIFIPRHGVNGQITARQVFLERDARVKINSKAMVTMSMLALGAGQCVFLARIRVQEDRKRGANLAEITVQKFIRSAANNNPVSFLVRHAQDFIAHSPADQIYRAAHFNGPPVS